MSCTIGLMVSWGSVPDWIGGVGTASATILFSLGWLRESRLRREDAERQAVLTIRQLVLDVQQLYLSTPTTNQRLSKAALAKEGRHLREIQAHTAAIRDATLRRTLYQITTFMDDGAVPALQEDPERLIAWNCCRYALDTIAAYVAGKPYPPAPEFVAKYQAAVDEFGEIMEQTYRDELNERIGHSHSVESGVQPGS